MVQEQRNTHRHTLALNTEVHYKEPGLHGMLRCRTGNISMSGVYLSAGELPLETDVDVELVLSAEAVPAAKKIRIQAQVVRASGVGVGLCFPSMKPETQREFRRFLMHAKVAAHHRASDEPS